MILTAQEAGDHSRAAPTERVGRVDGELCHQSKHMSVSGPPAPLKKTKKKKTQKKKKKKKKKSTLR
eukprot:TRINITY_DN2465_c0_g1_i6.p2 TRINITY_DN2465_c0_g1~~TRINITY_DN2465_c0_g1_i6.p2  ORF type:complete len:66 (+),score=39.42 TRINITY_DN2465_c0_g1_i6:35-232(+)